MKNLIFALALFFPVACFAGHGAIYDDPGFGDGGGFDPGQWYVGGDDEPENNSTSAKVEIDSNIKGISFISALSAVGFKIAQGMALAFGLAGALFAIQLLRRVIFQCGNSNDSTQIELDYYRDLERTREYNRGQKMELTPEERAIISGSK